MRPAILALALFATTLPALSATVLYDFETDAERAAVPCVANGEFAVCVTNGLATSGTHALGFFCRPWEAGRNEWPSFTLPSPVADWRGYDRLAVDVVNAGEEGDSLCIFVAGPEGRIQNGLSHALRLPGRDFVRWIVPLTSWPKTTSPDNIARIHFFVTRPQSFAVTLDRLTLLREGETPPAPDGPLVGRDLLPLVDADRREARRVAAEQREETAHVRDYFRFREACAAAGQTSPDFLLGTASSMEKVMPRGRFSAKPVTADGLAARLAGNEYESVQLLVAPKDADLEGVTVRLEGDLDGFPATNIAVSPVGYVHTTKTPPYKVVCAPAVQTAGTPAIGWWPDPILGFLGPVAIRGLDVQSFWIRVHCPAGQPAGLYRSALVVSAKGATPVRVPFAIRVNDFSLGRTSALPLAVTFGPCPTFQWEGEEGVAAAKARLADPLSPVNLWRRHEREWVSFLADYLIPQDNLYHKDYTNLLLAVRQLRDEGRAGFFNLGYWTAPASTNAADVAAWREKTIPRLTAMRDLAAELGILDLSYTYGCDEAVARDFPEVACAVREIKAALPGVPVCTTAWDKEFGVGTPLECVDWFVPKISWFDPAKAEAARAAGRKVWWYTCNEPHAPYPNFFIECPGIEARLLMGAQAVRNRPDGFMYYATSIWNSRRCIETGPFTDWDPRSWTTYHGDGSWTCAGPDGTPLPTIRLENFRDGLEDYAYAMLLERTLHEVESQRSKVEGSCTPSSSGRDAPTARPQGNESGRFVETSLPETARATWAQRARAALAVPPAVAASMTDFTYDPAALYRWRDEMADLIEEAAAFPASNLTTNP
ncbi:MAG: DUF4091 domain-containing protein [Kiritimatiellae bacterium]|nr:DUF4091 domain-containing protein [Kiritimatiellia bacterium]